MECCERTSNDKKGGHLASREGQLILREAAQCPDEDEDAFQDISKHRYFNTNNLWIDLEALKAIMTAHGGVVPLPMIKNKKTVHLQRLRETPSRRWRERETTSPRHRHNAGRPQGRRVDAGLPARDGDGCGHRMLQGRYCYCGPAHALRARQEVQRSIAIKI